MYLTLSAMKITVNYNSYLYLQQYLPLASLEIMTTFKEVALVFHCLDKLCLAVVQKWKFTGQIKWRL